MPNRSDLQTPYADAIAPTPSGAPDGSGTVGGFDIPDGRKETENSLSGLPLQPTTTYLEDGVPPGVVFPVNSPGTIPTRGTGE